MFTFLAKVPDQIPGSWYEVFLWPGFLTVIAVMIWVLARINEVKSGNKANWKYSAIVIIALALYWGFQPMSYMWDVIYASRIDDMGRKFSLAHYAAFFIPVIAIIAVAIWNVIDARKSDEPR